MLERWTKIGCENATVGKNGLTYSYAVANKTLAKLITYGVVLFLKYVFVYGTTGIRQKTLPSCLGDSIELYRDLRFSLHFPSFRSSDHFYIQVVKIFSEQRVSIIVVIFT